MAARRGAPSRREVEALGTFTWASSLTAGLDARAAWLPRRGVALEAVRADLRARWARAGANLAWRYNIRLADAADGFAGYVGLNDVSSGHASVHWQPHSRVRIAAFGSVRANSAGSLHVLAGPQIQFVGWLPWRGDLEAIELWENAGAGLVSSQGRWPGAAGRLLLRASAFTDQFMGNCLKR